MAKITRIAKSEKITKLVAVTTNDFNDGRICLGRQDLPFVENARKKLPKLTAAWQFLLRDNSVEDSASFSLEL